MTLVKSLLYLSYTDEYSTPFTSSNLVNSIIIVVYQLVYTLRSFYLYKDQNNWYSSTSKISCVSQVFPFVKLSPDLLYNLKPPWPKFHGHPVYPCLQTDHTPLHRPCNPHFFWRDRISITIFSSHTSIWKSLRNVKSRPSSFSSVVSSTSCFSLTPLFRHRFRCSPHSTPSVGTYRLDVSLGLSQGTFHPSY